MERKAKEERSRETVAGPRLWRFSGAFFWGLSGIGGFGVSWGIFGVFRVLGCLGCA